MSFQQNGQQEGTTDRFEWLKQIAGTTQFIMQNVLLSANTDLDQQRVSIDASKKICIMNICQALAYLHYDVFEDKQEFEAVSKDKKDKLLKSGHYWIIDDHSDKSLQYLYYWQTIFQNEAKLGAMLDEKRVSTINAFFDWKKSKGLL